MHNRYYNEIAIVHSASFACVLQEFINNAPLTHELCRQSDATLFQRISQFHGWEFKVIHAVGLSVPNCISSFIFHPTVRAIHTRIR